MNLVLGFLSYLIDHPQGLPYDGLAGIFPESPLRRESGPLMPLEPGVEYYNSNSFVAGLLVAAGIPVSEIPDPPWFQPGLDKPVPIRTLPMFSMTPKEIEGWKERQK